MKDCYLETQRLNGVTLADATIDNIIVHLEKANEEKGMLSLIKKEIALCLHPTVFIFLLLCRACICAELSV